MIWKLLIRMCKQLNLATDHGCSCRIKTRRPTPTRFLLTVPRCSLVQDSRYLRHLLRVRRMLSMRYNQLLLFLSMLKTILNLQWCVYGNKFKRKQI
ncbi:hypothetical protein RchiOBHm_Chr7g0183931 [Rosa chinensis]|uniref:Uncharacterized protein n=1 Tax=Rosa chinensis TaxID=74649 RepID=A0A2P6P3D1_ROSCH|nr:hypothetical protein RchiOBHm_Chr7g0183931 [Rosa chinensis]